MNMRYAKRSEDTEQINVVSWAGWNMNRYPELKWFPCTKRRKSKQAGGSQIQTDGCQSGCF